ncbi:MAG TPA: putative ABC transporter permease [Clostridiaceae bacterium]|jgi:hypothetical protein|nr:putative ABC transporter permease [Clostridiaceae bacterium]
MEKTNENIVKNNLEKNNKENKVKKNKTIFGFSIWRLIAYFIIYSVLGFIIETAFGAVTKGVIESRKSFLYGPFCAIYGLGAVVMILCLQPFKKNNNTLFWGGFVAGSVIEYLVSLIGELIFHVIWWDYSDMPLNINGRVCVYFSIFWGLLGIYLVSYVNPKIDKLINFIKRKISDKALKIIEMITAVFLIVDCLLTAYALKAFYIRMVKLHNINIGNVEMIDKEYDKMYGNKKKSDFIYKYLGDEKMIKTLPNLKLQDNDGKIVYFDSLLPDIQTYYYKFSDKGIRQKIVQDVEKVQKKGE